MSTVDDALSHLVDALREEYEVRADIEVEKCPRSHGVNVRLTSVELAMAIDHWLHARGVYVSGPRTIYIDEEQVRDKSVRVYVDPGAFVVWKGKRYGQGGPR